MKKHRPLLIEVDEIEHLFSCVERGALKYEDAAMRAIDVINTSIVKAQEETLHPIFDLVVKQTLDDGLWFEAPTASEAYLQQELRKLHALIEKLGANHE